MIEAKHIIFLMGSAICVPAGVLLSTTSRRFHDFVFMLLVFGTTQPETLFGMTTDINFLSREWYRGSTRGIEVSYLDLLALILLFSSLIVRQREGRRFFWPASLGILLTYFAWGATTLVVFSDPKIFSVFEVTKIARGIMVFLAVAAYVRTPREVKYFLYGLIAAIGYEAAVCLIDRYVHNLVRIRGTFPHPNSLSMFSLQCVPIFIAGFFSMRTSTFLRTASMVAFVAAAGCVLLSISRTGFATLVLLSAATFALCTGLRMTPRNIGLSLLGLLIGALMITKAWDSIMSRMSGFDFEREYMSEEGDRGSYFRQAAPIMRDYPLSGLGLNNWSYWVSNRYAEQAGYEMDPYPSIYAAPDVHQQAPPAHNLYLLTAAELGWPGLFLLLALFFRWFFLGVRSIRSPEHGLSGRIWLGTFISLCAIMMQSWTEWEFRQTPMFFLAHITMAVLAVLHRNLGRRAPV